MSRDFPGTTGNYLVVADVSAVDITGTAVTLCTWIRPDAVGTTPQTSKIVMNKGHNVQTDRQYGIGIGSVDPNVPLAWVGDAAGRDLVIGSTGLSAGQWYHLCGRKNGTAGNALQVFLNGVVDGATTSTKTIQNTSHTLRFGNWSGGTDELYDGLIAEGGLWNVALTDAEIAALSRGVSPLLIRPQSLRGYWPLFGTGSPERDYSGLGSHATINGTVAAGTRHAPVMPFVPPNRLSIPAPSIPGYVDEGTVYVDIQPASADIADTVDAATVYVNLQSSGVDVREQFDAATVLIDLQPLGGECYSTFSSENFGEGEANLRWVGASNLRWSADEDLRWSASVSVGDAIHC